MELSGAPGVTRTPDLLVRSQTLYPTELQARLEEGPAPNLAGLGWDIKFAVDDLDDLAAAI
jgi:hypothetical protein